MLLWTDGSLADSKRVLATSLLVPASAREVAAVRSEGAHLFDAGETLAETPKLVSSWLHQKIQTAAVAEPVGLGGWLGVLDVRKREVRVGTECGMCTQFRNGTQKLA